MEECNKFKALYRVQANNESDFYQSRYYPAKRVVVRNDGNIFFNPDDNKYVYFSRTPYHHSCYIFNKVIRIINSEINAVKKQIINANTNLPRCLTKRHYDEVNVHIIRDVQRFFKDYVPPQYVELISFRYLNTFCQLFEKCAIIDRTNKNHIIPELSDVALHGGAYGMNAEWLNLLNCCTISTQTRTLSIDSFFDFLCDSSPMANKSKWYYHELYTSEKMLLELLKDMTCTSQDNPQFYNKNNANNIVHCVCEIERKGAYNLPGLDARAFFLAAKRTLKQECSDARE